MQNGKPKISVEVKSISMTGYSILIISKPTDHPNTPSVHQQFPTDIALYIQSLIQKDQ